DEGGGRPAGGGNERTRRVFDGLPARGGGGATRRETRVLEGRGMPLLALDSVATLEPLARWVSDPASLPRVPLTTLPTPVEPLERLARASGIAPLYIKRDDAGGTLYGGNKPPKLRLLLGGGG